MGDPQDSFAEARAQMVLEQLAGRGIRSPRVLAAAASVPRHEFVADHLRALAYSDRPLPIGSGQTISQPYMVARATELAEPEPQDRALEIGAGCGYQAAILARLCSRVYAVEIVPELAAMAEATLRRLAFDTVAVAAFDGSGGFPGEAPFDLIIVSAGAPRVPPLLADQLAEGGRLVIPLGTRGDQVLALVRREHDVFETRFDTACHYVDLVGRYGVGASPVSA